MQRTHHSAAVVLWVTAVLGFWSGLSTAQGPNSLFLSYSCGAKPCPTLIPVQSGNPTMESRNIKRPRYFNDALIIIRHSNGNATASVKWHTLTAEGLPSEGGETYEIQNVETSNSRLIRLPTGTQGEHDFYLVVAEPSSVGSSEFMDFPQFVWDHDQGELAQVP